MVTLWLFFLQWRADGAQTMLLFWNCFLNSNGSGKTSLAMAALWAITGSADPRPFQDNKVADVLNDSNQVGLLLRQRFDGGRVRDGLSHLCFVSFVFLRMLV
jgi:hypothetical protein